MINRHIVSALAITAGLFSQSGFADTYDYSRTFTGRVMEEYTSTWVEETNTLSLTSSWQASANITKVSFLLSDGGSPWVTGDNDSNTQKNEQFLFYELDLAANRVDILTYFGRQLIESHNNILGLTADTLSFSLDHTSLNQMTFSGHSFQGAGFKDEIGIWYYMDSGNDRVETYDVHYGTTVKSTTQPLNPAAVPEPSAVALLALSLLTMAKRKFKA